MTDRIEQKECPPEIALRLKVAGGTNPFGEPNFRVVWGCNRVVKMTGQWGVAGGPVETREVLKYLPGSRWHLEMWRPPEEYGNPETWGKLGEEVIGNMTVDTAGPFPSRGEYELCYTLSSDGTMYGEFVPLNATVVELIVGMIKQGAKERITMEQRIQAKRQRLERERQERVSQTTIELLDARPAFYDQPTSFSTGPKIHRIN